MLCSWECNRGLLLHWPCMRESLIHPYMDLLANTAVLSTMPWSLCVCAFVEQYDQAISDLSECLDIQQQLLTADDRRVAETRYQLGLACTFDKRYDAALQHYRRAIDVIEAKMKRLSQVVAGEILPSADIDPHGFDTPQQLAAKEMDELSGIIPDILAKVD